MNWLAHILLSTRDVEYQIGNLLADPLKGKPWPSANQAVIHGMQMHTAIDIFTDTHPIVLQSKHRLGKGYLKGVVIDLLYDHFLANAWQTYTSTPIESFVDHFHHQAQVVSSDYPERPQRIVQGICKADILNSYAEFSGFEKALSRIDSRLSERARSKDSALSYVGAVETHYLDLQQDFSNFFPELIQFFTEHALGSANNHVFR